MNSRNLFVVMGWHFMKIGLGLDMQVHFLFDDERYRNRPGPWNLRLPKLRIMRAQVCSMI